MTNRAKGTSVVIAILTAVLSLVSALAVAFVGYQSAIMRAQIERSIEEDRLALDGAKLELQAEIDKLNASIEQE